MFVAVDAFAGVVLVIYLCCCGYACGTVCDAVGVVVGYIVG